MIRDVASIILCLLITVYIVQRRDLPILTRLVILYAMLWIVNAVISSFDYYLVKPRNDMKPGTIINYAFRTTPVSYYPLDLYRLFGDRYLHFALVVSHPEGLRVIETRHKAIQEFEPYRVNTTIKGVMYCAPLELYLNYWGKSVIFRTLTPPENVSVEYNPQIIQQISDESRYTICSGFCMRYLALSGVIPGCPVTLSNILKYIPLVSSADLVNRNWREDYFVV